MIEALKKKETYQRYWESLKFGFYCMSHPADGYWDLTHEHRGTMAAANTILLVTIFVRIISLKYTSFIFNLVNWEEESIIKYIAIILFPLALWVIGNWGTTTLFDGKGRLGQIYMATCYGMLPYPVVQVPLMILSNFITVDEKEFYSTINVLALVYAALLIITAMGEIHEFSFGKNMLFTVATLFAALVIVFILMLFFSMISQGVAYFISLGKELLFRL